MYEGLITLADPTMSWVARWQRLDGYVAGTYATKVQGSVSLKIEREEGREGWYDADGLV